MPRTHCHEVLGEKMVLLYDEKPIVLCRYGCAIEFVRFCIHISIHATVFPQNEIPPQVGFQRTLAIETRQHS